MADVDSTVSKICRKCGGVELNSAGQCKPCISAYHAKRYADDPARYKAEAKKWQTANPERVKINNAKWKARNATTRRNREKEKISAALWLAKNPDARRIRNQNRRARKRKNGGRLSKGLAQKLFKLQRGKCPCCGLPLGDDYHLDHKMPIALGGAHEDSNMQLLRHLCNNQKHAKHPIDFMQSRGFLL